MNQLNEHPLRCRLFNEAHTRPYALIAVPARLSHLVLLTGEIQPDKECSHIGELAERYGVTPPVANATHFSADFGAFSVKWERHTEFSSYTFYSENEISEPFEKPVIESVPEEWLAGLEGKLLVAQHVELRRAGDEKDNLEWLQSHFWKESLVGSRVADSAATVWTDFRLQKDGFSQLLIFDQKMTAHQAGRLVQHLLEMESYRMLAMLGFPLVEQYGPKITEIGKSLTELTQEMTSASSLEEERRLLEKLTSLEADIELVSAATSYRFGATRAYRAIVHDRIERLLGGRIAGVQMVSKYLERRFLPAMNACDSVAGRLENLSRRIARASQILVARVDLALESQNRDLLHSMNRRARLQLRLQETVEGLSIAAISYYIVGLVGYLAKAGKAAGMPYEPDLLVGGSIPLVVVGVWMGVRKIKKRLTKDQSSE